MNRQAKSIGNGEDFINEVLEAVRILAEPVKKTLGPDGQTIILEREDGSIFMTKDGVTVAENILVENPVHNSIIKAIKEASSRTNELVGDGTTTAIVLVEAIITTGMKYIKSGVISAQALAKEIKACLPEIMKHLEEMKRSISTETDIKHVARIAANNDEMMSEKVAEAIQRAGTEGLFVIEKGMGSDIEVKQIEGYQIGKGWSSHRDYAPRMITDKIRQEILYNNNPGIFLYNGELLDVEDFSTIVMAHNQIDTATQRPFNMSPLVIVAHAFGGKIRDYVAENAAVNGLQIMLVETEMMGTPTSRVLMLDDLAALTGGTVVQHEIPESEKPVNKLTLAEDNIMTIQYNTIKSSLVRKSPTLDAFKDGIVGKCSNVKQLKSTTTFYGGAGDKTELSKYLDVIRKQIIDTDHWSDKNNHRKRLARLLDGLVMISVGGNTELEIKERRDRIEDAVQATRAATKEGVVPGGGVALLKCAVKLGSGLHGDYRTGDFGLKVMFRAMEAPIRQILINAGLKPDIVVYQLFNIFGLNDNFVCSSEGVQTAEKVNLSPGFDALKAQIVNDTFEAGIIDPFLVVKTALENAVSISCEILRGGGYVVYADRPVKENNHSMSTMETTDGY